MLIFATEPFQKNLKFVKLFLMDARPAILRHSPTQKMPSAFFVRDLGSTAARQHGNYTHLLNNRVNYLTVVFTQILFFSLWKNAGLPLVREYLLFYNA